MKCAACKYEHEIRRTTSLTEEIIKGNQPFKAIKTQLPIANDEYLDVEMRTIYICPKCGTLKINI